LSRGALFVFRAKRAVRTKLLVWDQAGMMLVHKRLEGGKFVWPQVRCGVKRTDVFTYRASRRMLLAAKQITAFPDKYCYRLDEVEGEV
jgi:transposase